ncbi:hypothetical protein [Profundibacter sp.]
MPIQIEIEHWVREKYGRATQPCWISECKALALGLPHPEKNRDGSLRKKQATQPLREDMKKMIFEAFDALGVPNGKRI